MTSACSDTFIVCCMYRAGCAWHLQVDAVVHAVGKAAGVQPRELADSR
jgi:hypothetical protein